MEQKEIGWWKKEFDKTSPLAFGGRKWAKDFISRVEETARKDERERVLVERDTQILSWYKIPIKPFKIGRMECDVCGYNLNCIRGKYPKDENRLACTTCAIETLEGIYGNLHPNNEAVSDSTALKGLDNNK